MKKLKLKALELGANEVLTRAQLKNVLGGSGGITTTTGGVGIGTCPDDSCGASTHSSCNFPYNCVGTLMTCKDSNTNALVTKSVYTCVL